MDEKVKIVVPSRGRAKNVKTKSVVNDIILVVPFDEFDEYKEYNQEIEIIQRPKQVMGISRVRQYILDQFDEPFMLDDDVDFLHRFFAEKGEPYKVNDPQIAREIIEQLRSIARGTGAKMYGFTNYTLPIHFKPWKPFRTNVFMCASQCGFLKGHGLKQNFEIVSADDYWMTCLNKFQNRFAIRDERYGFISDNFTNSGGLQTVRNVDNMKSDTLILRENFGEAVELKKGTNHKVKMNEGERTVKFPY